MSDTPAIELRDVRVTAQGLRRAMLNGSNGDDATILDGVSLSVQPGEVVSVLGESGGGKTTLLRTICRLVDADSGEVRVLGQDVHEWETAKLRRRALFVPQRSHLFGGSVRDELAAPLQWAGLGADDNELTAALGTVQLETALEREASELSEGQRQRLCLARAVLLKPAILLLDEPTGALDVRTSREMLASLLQWARAQRVTLLCVTHKPEDVEVLGGDAVVLLNGKLAGRYSADEMLNGKVAEEVGAFLGSSSRSSGGRG
jgi:ABC-type multidrug transport system fused ATPase/permease subunit